MLYASFLLIHKLIVSAALLLLVLGELLFLLARTGQPLSAKLALRSTHVGKVVVTIGMLAGFVLVFDGGWSPFALWLVASYALVAALMVAERKIVRPWEASIKDTLRASINKENLASLARNNHALAGRLAQVSALIAVALLMSFKPTLGLAL